MSRKVPTKSAARAARPRSGKGSNDQPLPHHRTVRAAWWPEDKTSSIVQPDLSSVESPGTLWTCCLASTNAAHRRGITFALGLAAASSPHSASQVFSLGRSLTSRPCWASRPSKAFELRPDFLPDLATKAAMIEPMNQRAETTNLVFRASTEYVAYI